MNFSPTRHVIFLCLLALITAASLYILSPLAYPLIWAAIIAGVFYPMYQWLERHIKLPNLSAAISLAVIFIIIALPLTAVSSLVVRESINLYSAINNNGSQINASVRATFDWIKHNPLTAQLNINEQDWAQKFADLAQSVTGYLFVAAKNLTQNSVEFLVMFLLMFYALFFFIRDGVKLLKKMMHLCPLGDSHEKMLYEKFVSTARATLKGSLIVGLVQGALGGTMFAVVGIQGAVIWGVLMVLLSVIPGIGSYFIWLPAAVVMIILGNVWTGIGMIVFGALVIGTIDNIIRPYLVGKDTQMHPVLVLFSTLGGIVVFGISGFVIGPIITALLLAFWEMYEHAYRKELNEG